MASAIRIGNQTAFSASRTLDPLEFAVEHRFRAFEWFPDKKLDAQGKPAGWDETDMAEEKRYLLRQIGSSHDIRYSVHAPWQANPLQPEGAALLRRSVDFARDIGADLVNLHLYVEQGAKAYVAALAPVLAYAADQGVHISIENTPLTGPADFTQTFELLASRGMDARQVGMCFDLGHANLYAGTRNNYIRYIDQIPNGVPITHLHLHENWGDRDSHLPLFTGPARDNDAGIQSFVERMQRRAYSGAVILEQWPQPPELLVEAEQRLRELFRAPSSAGRHPSHKPARRGVSTDEAEPDPAAIRPPAPGSFAARIVAAHQRFSSWRERLDWIRDSVTAAEFAGTAQELAHLAVYLRFLGTGELLCAEDGRHFRPHHHAHAAMEISSRLQQITAPADRWILRKIDPWLPSFSAEFQRSEPLTRIRDIAHRNDIPQELKREIKHRLQNKLHRCAGPEDLRTASEILERVTSARGEHAPDFVEQFEIFFHELSDFFNASTLDQRLERLLPLVRGHDRAAVRAFLTAKAKQRQTPGQLLDLLERLTRLRERLASLSSEAEAEPAQQMRLADIGLEDFAFALLSDAENRIQHDGKRDTWDALQRLLVTAVGNLEMSGPESDECRLIGSELSAWRRNFSPHSTFDLLRLKATLERVRRLSENYTDRVLALFSPAAQALGTTLGVADHAVRTFCEGDIRGNLVFQLAKLAEGAEREIRSALQLPPWSAVNPGEAFGILQRATRLADLQDPSHPVIALVDGAEGDEEIAPRIRGILLGHPIPHLSHLGVRTRQAGIPFATAEDPGCFSVFEHLLDVPVHLRLSATETLLEAAEAPSKTGQAPAAAGEQPAVGSATLAGGIQVLALGEVTTALCGAKAAGAATLFQLAQASDGLFRAPPGLALPFGCMERVLERDPAAAQEYQTLLKQLPNATADAADQARRRLGEILRGLNIAERLGAEIATFFGTATKLAVRSSSNGEDLEHLAGAGLYDSVIGVAPADIAAAIPVVWASLWTRRATLSRMQAGIAHTDLHMAVLIQEMIAPELSFIMHTADPLTGARDQAWVELAVGLGETLASAHEPGNPYRLACRRDTGATRIETCASFSRALQPAAEGGTRWEPIDYSKFALSADPVRAQVLGSQLVKIAALLERELGGPQDVESVIVGDTIHLVQTRPQQGPTAKARGRAQSDAALVQAR